MKQFIVRFEETDLETLKNAALRNGVTTSEFIRGAALAKAKKVLRRQPQEKDNEKENIPPTPPIREKEKEKEPYLAQARACACEEKSEEAKPTQEEFQKPTIEEVREYMAQMDYHFDAKCFMDFYEENGWHVKNKPMRSWKRACTTWESSRIEYAQSRKSARQSRLEAQRKRIALNPNIKYTEDAFEAMFKKGGK